MNIVNFENIESEIGLGNKVLISYTNSNKISDSSLNVNISIGIATSSYAIIHMSKFKNNPNFNIYYSDTDSFYIDKPLDSKYIGRKLGQFKLEYIFTDAVFLAPKVYGGITEDGQEITKVKG